MKTALVFLLACGTVAGQSPRKAACSTPGLVRNGMACDGEHWIKISKPSSKKREWPDADDSFHNRQAHFMKSCDELIGPWQRTIEAFNKAHKEEGVFANLDCMWSPPQAEKRPIQTYPITSEESVYLNILRHDSSIAYANQGAYENYLYAAHGVHKPDIGDPCYHFVGFILDDDYITDNPNGWFGYGDCPSLAAPPEPVKPQTLPGTSCMWGQPCLDGAPPSNYCDQFPNQSRVAPVSKEKP